MFETFISDPFVPSNVHLHKDQDECVLGNLASEEIHVHSSAWAETRAPFQSCERDSVGDSHNNVEILFKKLNITGRSASVPITPSSSTYTVNWLYDSCRAATGARKRLPTGRSSALEITIRQYIRAWIVTAYNRHIVNVPVLHRLVRCWTKAKLITSRCRSSKSVGICRPDGRCRCIKRCDSTISHIVTSHS